MAVLTESLAVSGNQPARRGSPSLEAMPTPFATSRFRHLLITDSPEAARESTAIVVWLGAGDSPPDVATSSCLIVPSSQRAAAIYVAAGPSHFKLALSNPLPFMVLLAEVRTAPALRAA